MDIAVKIRMHRFGAWCGVGYLVALVIGWILLAGFIPPPSPAEPAAQVAARYQEDALWIRIGMVFVMFGALLMIPFTASIAKLMSRIEDGPGMLTYTALLGGAGNMVLTFYPATYWLWAAYRPDRGDQLIQMINDVAWLQFVGGVSMFLALPLVTAAAGLIDTRPDALVPRWAGYASVWAAFLIVPDQLIFFFKTGPFAWNGIFGLYLPLVGVGIWWVLIIALIVRTARRVVVGDEAPRPVAGPAPVQPV